MPDSQPVQQEYDSKMPVFERERLERIKRNRQILCDLGLDKPPELLLANAGKSKRQKRVKTAEVLEPTRRSRRLQHQQPEGWQMLAEEQEDAQQEMQQHRQQPRQRQQQQQQYPADEGPSSTWTGSQLNKSGLNDLLQRDPSNPHHQHNIHRLRSMSGKALMTRVWRITNHAKLDSLVQVLLAGDGPADLLEAAQEALGQL